MLSLPLNLARLVWACVCVSIVYAAAVVAFLSGWTPSGPPASTASSASSPVMRVKTVWFIRHGQAEHNAANNDPNIRDPGLTTQGLRQARAIPEAMSRTSMHDLNTAQVIVSSPLRRALQTALEAFAWKIEEGVALVPHADLQEVGRGQLPCDTGSPPGSLIKEFPQIPAKMFLALGEGWFELPENEESAAGHREGLKKRLQRLTQWLADLPYERILVVAHHGLFLEWLGVEFVNGEVREYELDPDLSLRGVAATMSLSEEE